MQNSQTDTKSVASYRANLVACMNFSFGTAHPRTHTFSNDELFQLTPEHVYAFCANKVYGTPTPTAGIDKPTLGRATTIEFAKKAISFFMPNRLMPWNEQTRSGNPTRSTAVNDLIKAVKKQEVRKEGKKSSARRPMALVEFVAMIERFRNDPLDLCKHTLAAYFIFQCNMVARVDDVAHFRFEDLTASVEYPFTLQSKMCWSKNVLEERDAPEQIIFGANDPTFCVLLALGIHLEHGLLSGRLGGGQDEEDVDEDEDEARQSPLLFGINKNTASRRLMAVIQDESFPRTLPGLLGTHSLRKFPATYARRNGCGRDDLDVRGRWKNKKRQVDTYIGVLLPYPDAKVAATLCVGGPVKYELRRGCGVTEQWLIDNVVVQVGRHFPRGVALVLGKALLWGIFNENTTALIDNAMSERVKAAVLRLNSNLPVGMNPVRKIPVIVSGDEGSLMITEMDDEDDDERMDEDDGGTNGGGGAGDGTSSAAARRNRIRRGENETSIQVRVLSHSVRALRRQNDELKNEIHLFKQSTNTLLSNLNASIRRLAVVPVSRPRISRTVIEEVLENEFGGRIGGVGGDDGDGDDGDDGGDDGDDEMGGNVVTPLRRVRSRAVTIPYHQTLCKCPKTLHVLWTEYEFGVGGRKAAKTFNASERGKVRFNFSLRKPFWDLVLIMARRGYTHNTAIDKIYSVYSSRLSVTQILREIRKDRKRGGHPELI
jgi:hypothetical protein